MLDTNQHINTINKDTIHTTSTVARASKKMLTYLRMVFSSALQQLCSMFSVESHHSRFRVQSKCFISRIEFILYVWSSIKSHNNPQWIGEMPTRALKRRTMVLAETCCKSRPWTYSEAIRRNLTPSVYALLIISSISLQRGYKI